MDKEDFEQWLDSPMTRHVFAKVNERADQIEEQLKEMLFASTGMTAAEWADLQGRSGYDRGTVAGIRHVTQLTYEEIEDGEPERDSSNGV